MGLESLLARLEHLEHQGTRGGVPGKPLQNKHGTPNTPRTPEIERGEAVIAPMRPDADPLWWRVTITEPGGRTVEVDAPSGATIADWRAYADRYHGPGCTVRPIARLPKPPRAPVNLDEAIRAACEGVAGITAAQFRALLSPEDITDIEAGDIPA
jgi:hypothetical protein